nr:unnamed protein product [Digitaria exilis]
MEHHGCILLVAVASLLASSSWAYASAGTDTDHRGLMQFRSLITDDPYGAMASWGSANASAPCGWRGVTCGARGRRRGRVTALDLRGLSLSGSMAPSSLAGLTYLRRLDLSHNNLTGTIPASLGNLTSLTLLSLTSNKLSGAIPGALGTLQALTGLYINGNMLQGSIPPAVFNLSSLQELVVQFNNLTGTLPPDAGARLPSLWLLSVDSNRLHGTIPVSLCNASRLEVIATMYNPFSGVVPDCLGALNNLWALSLDFNELEANAYSHWGFMDSLTNCSNLKVIGLAGNKLGGVLPASIANLSTSMETLGLWGNMISGQIPQEIGNLFNLRIIWMNQNNFTGTIPDSLGRLDKLGKLYLYSNRLSGQIPPTIGNLTLLSELSLENNTLTGPVPSSLGSCRLETLSLDNNRLTDFLGTLKNLQELDLSYNSFDGEVPESGIFLNASAFSVEGNTALCGGIVELKLPPCSKDGITTGVGSFGSVYKGTMMINDQEVVVAVKVLNLLQRGASRSFSAECETLRCARHRNLVKILTVCSSIEPGGLDFKALVFDFLPNGNLDQWLHIWEHGTHRGLDLAQRIDIAIDVASALEYLHHYRPTPIVHCDLKPSNILLDNDMVAHVGDFGLARFVYQDQTSLSDISSGWATRRGTIGYAAPGQILTSTSACFQD